MAQEIESPTKTHAQTGEQINSAEPSSECSPVCFSICPFLKPTLGKSVEVNHISAGLPVSLFQYTLYLMDNGLLVEGINYHKVIADYVEGKDFS